MNDNVVSPIQSTPTQDLLTDLIRNGARDLIARAVEAELNELLAQYATEQVDGKRRVVRNGYLPARQVQNGVGTVEVKIPKLRDRACGGVKCNSSLIPPYLKRSNSIEDLLPLLYLKGVSTGDFKALFKKGFHPPQYNVYIKPICNLFLWLKPSVFLNVK
jgi:transposase-like protein